MLTIYRAKADELDSSLIEALKTLFAGRELECHLGLAAAEVAVLRIVRNRLARLGRRGDIDQQVMMPGIRMRDARRRHTHAAQTEAHGEFPGHVRAIRRLDEIDAGTGGRGGRRNRLAGERRSRQQQQT